MANKVAKPPKVANVKTAVAPFVVLDERTLRKMTKGAKPVRQRACARA
jgi:hypothetical protein